MRAPNAEPGPEPTRPPVAWLPGPLDGGVCLRLRLSRHGDRARGRWHLVEPGADSRSVGKRPVNPDPQTGSSQSSPSARIQPNMDLSMQSSVLQGLMSISSSAALDMQNPGLGPQFIVGPPPKVPGRKRGRPPIRKLEFQHHYPEVLSALKVPKKRGRKPGFKLKPRMLMSPLADSAPSSTPEPELSSLPQDAAIVPRSATPQAHTAETSVPDDFLCDPVDSKRYAVDPSDSAFGVMATGFRPKHSYGYRGSSSSGCSNPTAMCRRASSPGNFQDPNRNTAYSPGSEAGDCKRPAGRDPSSWGVEEVVWFIKDSDPQALGPHAEAFRKHEIDGDALLLLKSEMMMKYLGLKLGPALKLCYHIDRLRQNRP